MAYGEVPEIGDITDMSTPGTSTIPENAPEATGAAIAYDLVKQLGQFSLESSPVLTAKTRKYSLRELEIQQTIGINSSYLLLMKVKF